MLDTLQIKIYGNSLNKYLIYEDNGKGISPQLLNNIFRDFGVSTKNISGEIHGFGLYSCLQYCLSMSAVITVDSKEGHYTRFTIKFDRIQKTISSSDTQIPAVKPSK
jgi:sensor histidine kinase regulating citrate/malate metabolism